MGYQRVILERGEQQQETLLPAGLARPGRRLRLWNDAGHWSDWRVRQIIREAESVPVGSPDSRHQRN
jgi:hypothetical protein